ncbi:unnamed protein product [Allacma fusca]|uniref:Uncharacterized protein n=1 Tax=Allacma fusca TaxID=39272 RepID=A0A8J2KVK1_9HEXA|nr:unnamed protein product [Allacma fusca]
MRQLLLFQILIVTGDQIKLNNQYSKRIANTESFTIFSTCILKLLTACTKYCGNSFPDELNEISWFYSRHSLTPTIGWETFNANVTDASINTNYRVNSLVTTRFTKCFVILHLQEWVDLEGTNILLNFPYFTHLQRDNPDYVVVMTGNATESHLHYLKTATLWFYYAFVSHAKIIFIRNGNYSQLLCIPCLKEVSNLHEDQIFLNISNMDLDSIDEFAIRVSGDLLKAPVAQNIRLSSAGCSPLIVSRTLAGSCAQELLGSKLNFTPSLKSFNDIKFGTFYDVEPTHCSAIAFEIISDQNMASRIANYYKPFLFDYIVTAEIFDSFTFLLVISEPALMHSGLWEGMDIITWGLIALSAIVTILALKFSRRQYAPTMNASEVVICFLLEQGQLPLKKSLQIIGTNGACIVAIWAIVSTVISNGYKGNMFSLLTSLSLPNIPVNWEEIIKSERFLVSPAYFYFQTSIDGDSKYSLLHQSILELQAERKLNKRLNTTLSDLSHKLVFTNATSSIIAYSQTSQGKEIHLSSPSQPFRLPDDYIFIQQDRHLRLYSMLMKVAKNKSLVLQGPIQDLFLERIPIMIVRNFLTENYIKKLFKIVESGLWSMWQKYSDMYKNLIEMKEFIELARQAEPEYTSRYNLIGLVWGNSKTLRGMSDLVGLQLDTFRMVFMLYWLGLLTSLGSFIYEMYGCRAWEKWRNPRIES